MEKMSSGYTPDPLRFDPIPAMAPVESQQVVEYYPQGSRTVTHGNPAEFILPETMAFADFSSSYFAFDIKPTVTAGGLDTNVFLDGGAHCVIQNYECWSERDSGRRLDLIQRYHRLYNLLQDFVDKSHLSSVDGISQGGPMELQYFDNPNVTASTTTMDIAVVGTGAAGITDATSLVATAAAAIGGGATANGWTATFGTTLTTSHTKRIKPYRCAQIATGQSLEVTHQPLGFFQTSKYVPLWLMGKIHFRFEFENSLTALMNGQNDRNGDATVDVSVAASEYVIENLRLVVKLVNFGKDASNFYNTLASRQTLQIPYPTWKAHQYVSATASGNVNVGAPIQAKSLKSIFMIAHDQAQDTRSERAASNSLSTRMWAGITNLQFRLGEMLVPQRAITISSGSESTATRRYASVFNELMNALGRIGDVSTGTNIDPILFTGQTIGGTAATSGVFNLATDGTQNARLTECQFAVGFDLESINAPGMDGKLTSGKNTYGKGDQMEFTFQTGAHGVTVVYDVYGLCDAVVRIPGDLTVVVDH